MKPLVIVFLAALMAGCASTKAPAPRVDHVRTAVTTSAGRVIEARKTASKAADSVNAAQIKAASLWRVVPVDLRPTVEALQTDLDAARQALQNTEKILEMTTADLAAAEKETALLQQQVDQLARQSFRDRQIALAAQKERDNATRKHDAAVRKLNRWRGAAIAVALVGSLIIFRRPLGAMLGVPIP